VRVNNATELTTELTYEARHTYLEQSVHLKSVPEPLWQDMSHDDRQHFHQWSTVFAQSTNPHLVRIIDGFEENGVPFLVFKPITGQPLAAWLQGRQLSVSEAIALLSPLVDAVASLHQSGIIHGALGHGALGHKALGGNTLIVREHQQMVVVADIPLRSFLPTRAIADQPELTIAQDIQGLATTAVALMTGNMMPTPALVASAQAGTLRNTAHCPSEAIEGAIARGLLAHLAQPQQTVSDWFEHLQRAVQSSPAVIEDANAAPQGDGLQDDGLQGDGLQGLANDTTPSVPTELIANGKSHQVPLPMSHPDATATDKAADASPNQPASGIQNGRSKAPSTKKSSQPPKARHRWRIPAALCLCSVVAASVGGYLGLSFRLQEPEQLDQSPIFGREIFGTEQSFPVSDQWPGKSSAEFDEDDFLFEQRTPRSLYSTPSELNDELIFPEVESESEALSSEDEALEDNAIGSELEDIFRRDTDSSGQDGVITTPPPSNANSPIIEAPPSPSDPTPQPLPPVFIPDGVDPPTSDSPAPSSDVQSEQIETTVPMGDRTSSLPLPVYVVIEDG
jgi:serine/threonine-protein kinase